MTQHTPGPWEANDEPIARGGLGGIVWGANGRPVAVTAHQDVEAEYHANRTLIASAPEMLDVLQTIENDAGQVPAWLWDRIQAVIAKATGDTRGDE